MASNNRIPTEWTPLAPTKRETRNKDPGKWFSWAQKRRIGELRYQAPPTIAPRLSQQELDQLTTDFATNDREEDKTWARRIVEKYLQNSKLYFPRKNEEGAPSLSKAWAYYEHMILPRYLWNTADHIFRLAEPGEASQTALFRPASMPESSFIEFGIGVDQYFSSLKLLSIMFLICALINIPNMLYYASPAYSGKGGKSHLPWALQASAICTRQEWVICKDCTADHWQWAEEADSFGTTDDGTVLVKRNNCGGAVLMDGIIDFVTFIFVTLFISALSMVLYARECRCDEDRLTADDYSLIVQNPPSDALDPAEWKEYFEQFAEKQVTVVTIALDNELLLKKLLERRLQVESLQNLLPRNIDMDDENMVRNALAKLIADREDANTNFLGRAFESLLRSVGLLIPAESIVDTINSLTDEIEELQDRKYSASTVFITFETEEGQRQAFAALSPKALKTLRASDNGIPVKYFFKGRLLSVDRPPEPNSVRWHELTTPLGSAAFARLANLLITILVIGFAAYCENATRRTFGPVYAGPLVSIFNSVIPLIVELLMYRERHRTEDSWQISYYAKVTLFRFVNTSIITKMSAALTANLEDQPTSVLPSMYSILWSELIVTPLCLLLDPVGNFKRHCLSPRFSMTQKEMNSCFLGTEYRLGERFTALTNILFVCFFYSALFPACFVFGFAILLVQYHTDKFCLVRIWRRSPAIGSKIARISRRYFFNVALVVFITSSAFSWSQFPYDNLCYKRLSRSQERTAQQGARGIVNSVKLLNGSVMDVTVDDEEIVYFCSQDVQDFDTTFPFPPLPSRIQPTGFKWMTEEQERISTLFGWAALIAVVTFVVHFLEEIRQYVRSFFESTYEPSTQSQKIDFSSNLSAEAYIPQISLSTRPYPLLACDVDLIDKELIGWMDPKHGYDKHNLIFDVPFRGLRKRSSVNALQHVDIVEEYTEKLMTGPIFSIVKWYPPDWNRRLQIERDMVGGSSAALC